MECDEKIIDLGSDLLSSDDALRCLTEQVEVIIPIPNVKACNNLDEYFMRSTLSSQKAQRINQLHTNTVGSSSKEDSFTVPQTRNFGNILKKSDDRQVQGSPRLLNIVKRKSKTDVFSKAEGLNSSSGPLVLLKSKLDCVVKVLIRRRRKVPYISRVIRYKGTLTLFDKHMNLYLRDVIESFTYKRGDKLLKRARYRENLLLRGDNIILISSQ